MRLTLTQATDDVFQALIRPKIATNLGALGTTQGTAFSVVSDINIFTQATAGSCAVIGDMLTPKKIVNRTGSDLTVFPPYGANFEALSVNAPALIPNGSSATFIPSSSTTLVIT